MQTVQWSKLNKQQCFLALFSFPSERISSALDVGHIPAKLYILSQIIHLFFKHFYYQMVYWYWLLIVMVVVVKLGAWPNKLNQICKMLKLNYYVMVWLRKWLQWNAQANTCKMSVYSERALEFSFLKDLAGLPSFNLVSDRIKIKVRCEK